ncbi:MAG: helix-turn-helix transcriptional regulator [Clostridia bacterium]|nr:helix-turn-helix transcriptional regulator [Clostridia bacterium]
MNLGENIFKQRTRCNFSQGDLANALEVSRQSVSKWENNSAVPELDKLIKMSALFKVSLDELVYAETKDTSADAETTPIGHSMKTTIGLILLIFGLISFLLSVFWGDHLRVGEEIGEIVSISIVLLSIAILANDNFKAFSLCAVISFLYSVVCFGFLNVTSLQNYFFVFLTNMIILIWFITMGMHANKGSEQK